VATEFLEFKKEAEKLVRFNQRCAKIIYKLNTKRMNILSEYKSKYKMFDLTNKDDDFILFNFAKDLLDAIGCVYYKTKLINTSDGKQHVTHVYLYKPDMISNIEQNIEKLSDMYNKINHSYYYELYKDLHITSIKNYDEIHKFINDIRIKTIRNNIV
jgi:hypothetical protein